MLTDLGLPFLRWLHDKVCTFDYYLAKWLYVLEGSPDEWPSELG
jgi:hypothetical protein